MNMLQDTDRDHFALALSGGGARASLYCMGGLVALVDRGVSPRVSQISSVSGGSITNAFVAQRCEFSSVGSDAMLAIAADFTRRVRKGVLTRTRLLLLGMSLFATALMTAYLVRRVGGGVVLPIGTAIVTLGLGLLAVGRITESLLARRYFSVPAGPGLPGSTRPSSDVPAVEHVFCATDLASGRPVYISGFTPGGLWRHRAGTLTYSRIVGRPLTVAEVVRASAAFPGIPPRRRRVEDSQDHESPPRRTTLWMADGGLWNNLGTQALREDGLYAGKVWDRLQANVITGPSGTDARLPSDQPLLCINSSAPLTRAPGWIFHIPVIGTVAGLARSMGILAVNTVTPRTASMVGLLNVSDEVPAPQILNVVADIGTPYETLANAVNVAESALRTVDRIDSRAHDDSGTTDAGEAGSRHRYTNAVFDTSVVWLATLTNDTYARVAQRETRAQKFRLFQNNYALYPTTLGRVPKSAAFDLLLAGYINTFLWSLAVAPPAIDGEDVSLLFPPTQYILDRLSDAASGNATVRRDRRDYAYRPRSRQGGFLASQSSQRLLPAQPEDRVEKWIGLLPQSMAVPLEFIRAGVPGEISVAESVWQDAERFTREGRLREAKVLLLLLLNADDENVRRKAIRTLADVGSSYEHEGNVAAAIGLYRAIVARGAAEEVHDLGHRLAELDPSIAKHYSNCEICRARQVLPDLLAGSDWWNPELWNPEL